MRTNNRFVIQYTCFENVSIMFITSFDAIAVVIMQNLKIVSIVKQVIYYVIIPHEYCMGLIGTIIDKDRVLHG